MDIYAVEIKSSRTKINPVKFTIEESDADGGYYIYYSVDSDKFSADAQSSFDINRLAIRLRRRGRGAHHYGPGNGRRRNKDHYWDPIGPGSSYERATYRHYVLNESLSDCFFLPYDEALSCQHPHDYEYVINKFKCQLYRCDKTYGSSDSPYGTWDPLSPHNNLGRQTNGAPKSPVLPTASDEIWFYLK